MEPDSDCCKPPFKTREEDEGDFEESTMSLANAKKIGVVAAGVVVLSALDGIFTLKDTQIMLVKVFLSALLAGFG